MDNGKSVIVTFYSYKGGVGRSMAVANVACVLARDYGKKVLVVDWDLEAPGLHRFFGIEPKDLKPGLIDILEDYKGALSKDNASKLPDPLISIDNYITPAKSDFGSRGSVSLIAAGRQDETYAGRINAFSWDEFYQKWQGFGFFEYLKGELKQKADVVLLDSRTGVTDIGGICTLQLPDVVVLLFALNEQNISGVESIAKSIRERAAEVAKRETPPEILVRPARVEITLEEKLMTKWQGIAAERLRRYVPGGEDEALPYMVQKGIPYIGAYSFGETLAVTNNVLGPLAVAYKSLASSVMDAAGLDAAAPTPVNLRPRSWLVTNLSKVRDSFIAFSRSPSALRVALLIAVVLLLASSYAASLYYHELADARTAGAELRTKAMQLETERVKLQSSLDELRRTIGAVKSSYDEPPRSTYLTPSIDYCPKDDDERQKIETALVDLGFAMRKIPPQNDVPVNSVYFGASVDPEAAKNVALKLLQAGIQIKGIYRFQNNALKRKSTLVEVIGSRSNANATRPALTEEAIRNMKEFRTFTEENP